MKNRKFGFLSVMTAVMLVIMTMPFNLTAIAITYTNGFGDDNSYQPAVLNGDTYEISNAGQLYWFAGLVNGTLNGVTQNKSANGKLMNDITDNSGLSIDGSTVKLNGADISADNMPRSWTPIEYDSFGIFDGQGHTVKGIYCETDLDVAGLFGCIDGSTIKNIITDTCYIKSTHHSGISGSIAGVLSGSSNVLGCVTRNCRVISNRNVGDSGGIVGAEYNSEISDCTNESTTIMAANAGGIVGLSTGNVKKCTNKANLSYANYVGGIVGTLSINSGYVSYCANYGNIKSVTSAGCIVGELYGGEIHSCINYGNIEDNGGFGGGIAASIGLSWRSSKGSVSTCYNVGTITSKNVANPIGYIDDGTITDSYYLADSETDSYDGTTAKGASYFKSDEVAYNLNQILGHTVGTTNNLVPLTADLSNQVLKVTFKVGNNVKDVYVNNGQAVEVPSEYVGMKFINEDKDVVDLTTPITKDTTLSEIPAPIYTVTIPADISFGEVDRTVNGNPNRYKTIDNISVEVAGSYISSNDKKLTVSAKSSLALTNGEKTVPFSLSYGAQKTALAKNTSTVIGTFSKDKVSEKVPLEAKLDRSLLIYDNVKLSGTVTFTVALEDK